MTPDPRTMLTESTIRRALLEEFAKLTRHSAAKLDALGLLRVYLSPDDPLRIEVTFGKRHAVKDAPADCLSWSLDNFQAQIAAPLARDLAGSA